jgi:predicted CXXCH cytochrome family protein
MEEPGCHDPHSSAVAEVFQEIAATLVVGHHAPLMFRY